MIEILYSKIANLYGDAGNITLLERLFKQEEIIHTSLNDKPYFIDHDVDFVYLGSTSEYYLNLIIEKLKPYQQVVKEKIDKGLFMLVTGSSFDIIGTLVYEPEESAALNIVDMQTVRDYSRRLNCHYLGKYNDLEIVGFKSQFATYKTSQQSLFTTSIGFGNDINDANEGIHYHNLYATSLLGPLLILNPHFTSQLFKENGMDIEIPYHDDLMKAYQVRLGEFKEITQPQDYYFYIDNGN